MINEAIILAGGLGTRLRDVVPELPKCMALVSGKPFISYIIDYFESKGVNRFIFSLGYKSEFVERYLYENYKKLNYISVIEDEPLGTGGGIRLAVGEAKNSNILILNGDTLFKVKLEIVSEFHLKNDAECTIALKPMKDFDRYGAVEVNKLGLISAFSEKKFYQEGLINGGVYILNTQKFLEHPFPSRFSFELDYLIKYASANSFYGIVQNEYFIDIGIPSDYYKAQNDFG